MKGGVGGRGETGRSEDNEHIRERSYRKNVSSGALAGRAAAAPAAAGSQSQPAVAVFGSQAQNQYCCSSPAPAARPSHSGPCNTSTDGKKNPRKGKEIFLAWLTQDKYFVFASFPRQHLPFGFLVKACGWSWYSASQVPEGVSGLFLRGPDMTTGQRGDI